MSTIKFGTWQDLSGNEVANSTDPVGDGGLVHIKSVTIGSAVSSVDITDVFSSTYDNYLVLLNGITGGASAGDIIMQLNGATTSYYESFFYWAPAGSPSGNADVNNGTFFRVCTISANPQNNARFEVMSPYLNLVTQIHGQAYSRNIYNHYGGARDAASHTGFTLSTNPATTMTGGSVRVYGYRN